MYARKKLHNIGSRMADLFGVMLGGMKMETPNLPQQLLMMDQLWVPSTGGLWLAIKFLMPELLMKPDPKISRLFS
jgi:hypothetical protein